MKKLNFKRVFPLWLLALTAGFAGCNSEDVDFSTAELSLTPLSRILNFNADGTPVDGDTFTIHTNRSWNITGEGSVEPWEVVHETNEDFSWIALSRSEGSGSAEVSVKLLPNTGETRSVRLRVSASINHEYVTITQTGSIETRLLYNIKFGVDAAASSPYEYLDEWLAAGKDLMESGEGASTAEVEGSSVSLRKSGRLSTGYIGASGENKLFFSSNASFTIKTISSFGASRFKITFGAAHYGDNTNDFTYDKLSLEVSADGTTYVPVTYTVTPEPAKDAADWYFGTGYADIPTSNYVYVRFVANVASAISLDDVTVSSIIGGTPSGPQVTTAAATNITATSATVGGSYSPADATPSALGVEYKKGSEPYVRQAVTGGMQTPFTVALSGLTNGVTYTYRAYATFDGTTVYGNEMTFTAGGDGPGPGPGTQEIYRINFGTGAAASSPYEYLDEWIAAGKDLGQSGTGASSVTLTGTAVSLRKSGRLSSGYEGASGENKLFYGANANFVIENITTGGASDFTITFGAAHYSQPNNDFTYDKLTLEISADGATYTPVSYTATPEPAPSAADWYFCTGTATLANSGSLWVRLTATVASAISLDDVAVSTSGGGSPTFSFGQATFSGSLVKDTAINGAKITVPYYNASGQSYSGVNVTVSGAGSAGISVTQQSTVTLGSGTDNVEFTVTGTPTTAGAVTFTISGITDLTNPKNTVNTTVTEGATPGNAFFTETFGTNPQAASPWPKIAAYTFFDNGSPVVFSDEYATADIRKIKSGDNLTDHLWLPANKDSSLKISGINAAGKTNITLSFDLAANLYSAGEEINQNVVKINFDGQEFTLPSKVLSNANGDNNKFYSVSVALTGVTGTANSTLKIYSLTAENTKGMRVDNIELE